MNIKDLYLKYFEEKGHVIIPSAPVIPENDPTSLFNTAGMQPLVPYLKGQTHPAGTRLTDVQKCLRTNDLEEVGDLTHHTFFEMLGNWSLGDYFKKESITWSFQFLTQNLNIPVERLAVTVFEGNETIPRDTESFEIWKSLGIKEEKISYLGVEDNFWIAGETGPCGPDTEIFYWRSEDAVPSKHDPEDDRWVEIWNNVFMQYDKKADGTFLELAKKNVDTGMGVERITACLEGVTDNYASSIWKPIIEKIESLTGKSYLDTNYTKSMRIIADHMRAIVILSADNAGIKPSNTDQGYILRRLIRRMIRYAKKLEIVIDSTWDKELATLLINQYAPYYKELDQNKDVVFTVLKDEKQKFNRTLEKGLREFDKLVDKESNHIEADIAFKLYDTYGFPIELTSELATEKGMQVDIAGFHQKFKEHQEKSRAGARGKFKGGLSGDGEIETKYHTATHLLNAALREVLGEDVHQKGSNITPERMRFDFSFDRKLTPEEKSSIEDLVNRWITESLPVTHKEMTKEEALETGAEAMFIDKYGDIVTVYFIGDISKELCGGPHVENTNELGTFKIKKEEASSAGVRRIKAILE
ncbi:MAG: alanine--tRNA ligase [Bacilli bacterium]|nr:alanine--tRNA ligase [Bacilli bacterium]